jgi:hypothetical protein
MSISLPTGTLKEINFTQPLNETRLVTKIKTEAYQESHWSLSSSSCALKPLKSSPSVSELKSLRIASSDVGSFSLSLSSLSSGVQIPR